LHTLLNFNFGFIMSNVNCSSVMNDYSIEPVVDSELYEVEEIRHLYDLFDVSFNDNLLHVY